MIRKTQIQVSELIKQAHAARIGNKEGEYGAACREFVVRICGRLSGIGMDKEGRELAKAIGMPHLYPADEPTAEPTDWSAA